MSRSKPVAPIGLALLLAGLTAAPSAAQETDEDLAGPPMADAPAQFRVSATGGWLGWDDPDAPGEQRLDGGSLWGLDLETRMGRYLAFRFGAAYGRTTITGPDAGGTTRSVGANQVVVELAAEPRLSVEPLRGAGVVPFGIAGLGSVVHDPRAEPGELDPSPPTRSQGSLIYGAGVDASPDALGDLGVRLEWRRAEVQTQRLFVVTSREGTSRGSSRITGSVYWSF